MLELEAVGNLHGRRWVEMTATFAQYEIVIMTLYNVVVSTEIYQYSRSRARNTNRLAVGHYSTATKSTHFEVATTRSATWPNAYVSEYLQWLRGFGPERMHHRA